MDAPVTPPEPLPADTQIENTGKKRTWLPLLVTGIIVAALGTGLVLFLVFPRQPVPEPEEPTTPAVTDLPTPTTTQSASPTATAAPTLAATPPVSASPKLQSNPNGQTYTSRQLGVHFFLADSAEGSGAIKVQEQGSKLSVYPGSMKPQDGQSIERFEKSPADTLEQAIKKRFLSGISPSDCFVRINPKKPSPTITKATIGYPVPTNAEGPYFDYGQVCPENYKESNGMAYFLEDSRYPDRFYYVSIGQYGIPAQNNKPDSAWQDSLIIF